MNLMLIEPEQLDTAPRITITGRQFEHLRDTLRTTPGDQIKTGIIGGSSGHASIINIDTQSALIDISKLTQPAIPSTPITLLIALPRPQMLKRILQTAATFAVQKIIFIHTQKVEKSFWQSPRLKPNAIRQELILGAEQGGHTRLPDIALQPKAAMLHRDLLPSFADHDHKFVAHCCDNATPCQSAKPTQHYIVAIGPEGGFTQAEIDAFQTHHFQAITLGQHILRVETAVTAVLARMFV